MRADYLHATELAIHCCRSQLAQMLHDRLVAAILLELAQQPHKGRGMVHCNAAVLQVCQDLACWRVHDRLLICLPAFLASAAVVSKVRHSHHQCCNFMQHLKTFGFSFSRNYNTCFDLTSCCKWQSSFTEGEEWSIALQQEII